MIELALTMTLQSFAVLGAKELLGSGTEREWDWSSLEADGVYYNVQTAEEGNVVSRATVILYNVSSVRLMVLEMCRKSYR
jgi:hypothetical protein